MTRETLALVPELEVSHYHTLFDLCGRLCAMRGEKELAATFYAAAEWRQIRDGDPVLPIERYHHERSLTELGAAAQEQHAALKRARSMDDDELLQLAAALF